MTLTTAASHTSIRKSDGCSNSWRSGILDDTLVIVVGDHGEEFAEHGMMEHSNSLYLPSLHVPLIVSWVGRVPQNARVTVPVSLRDLPHTVMTMIDPHSERCFPGESWSNRFNGSSVGSSTTPILQASTRKAIRKTSWYPASRGNMRSVCIGNYHCIFNGDQTVEVYDFVADPWETHNLADRPEGREVISDARRQLDA